jgi:tetratricopeptide (TPR) repeat protein
MIVNAYLSREHFDDRDGSCPIIALPSDVARDGKGVKTAFRQVLDKMVEVFAGSRRFPWKSCKSCSSEASLPGRTFVRQQKPQRPSSRRDYPDRGSSLRKSRFCDDGQPRLGNRESIFFKPGAAMELSMSTRRAVTVLGVSFILLTSFMALGLLHAQSNAQNAASPPEPSPLAGNNSVTGLHVDQTKAGVWMAEFDYFYTGDPPFAALAVEVTPQTGTPPGPNGVEQYQTFPQRPQRGSHHASVEIRYPGGQMRTLKAAVTMRSQTFSPVVVASQQVDKVIDWPDFQTWLRDQQIAKVSPDDNFMRAVALIDSEGKQQLEDARSILERLIGENPKFDAGYVELARVAMKLHGNPEGLHQAENLLLSALQIRPDNVNAKILLGYVYAHENRFAKAESLFTEAAATKTNNLWLWSNWGELLTMEGKTDQAILKYRQAITHPMTHDTYDRARADAYENLLELLKTRKDPDAMEALYKQRVAEFGPGSCYTADYARFLLEVRGDTQASIELAKGALHQNCDDTESREILGLAEYVKWAATTGPLSVESLNQARIFLPAGPKPLYLLATSDRTTPAAKKLIASGEQIDQKDNGKLTALAYALQNQDLGAAKRLLVLGARPDTPVGQAEVPVALLPVLSADIDGVRMMLQSGVNYSKLKYRGATALEIAKQMGNPALIDALGGKETDL